VVLAERLAAAQPGDVVDLPAGRYTDEQFPISLPPGVTLRGAGARDTVIDAGGTTAVVLGAGAALERVTVTGGAPGYMMIPPTCVTGSGDEVTITDCHVESILLGGGDGHLVANNVIAGGKVWCMGTNRVTVRGNYQHGLRWGAGIECNGGAGHVIEHNECRDDLCAIRCTSTEDVEIAHNRYETRWFGIHLLDARNTRVSRNSAWRTMRAVDVEGGANNRVERQLAEHCDSGIVVEGGATGTALADSWLHDCRLGLLVWGADGCEVQEVAVSAPRDHAVVTDQPLALDGNQLDGDVWTR
jgi:nitrous oxidase accessory protein NosD